MGIAILFNATFNTISVLSWRQFYWWRKLEYPEKTTTTKSVVLSGYFGFFHH
jgi:hypothetical protein